MFNWVHELFIDSELCSPIFIDMENQFYAVFCRKLDLIIDRLKNSDAPSNLVDSVFTLNNNLKQAIKVYYEGDVAKSQNIIVSIIDNLLENPFSISNIKESTSLKGAGSVLLTKEYEDLLSAEVDFFRARISTRSETFEPHQMLHIGFDQREKVSTQRFSIPGLPCIYLSTSSYGCWTEMGRPADNSFCVSAIRLENNLRIFNLGINDSTLSELVNYAAKDAGNKIPTQSIKRAIENLLPLWVLSFASSFKLLQENMTFRSDYIIPQMIMLAVKKHGINGIAYYSKQNLFDDLAYPLGINVALFADYNGEKKLSQICKEIYISKSVNFSEFKQLYASSQHSPYRLFVDFFASSFAKIAGKLHHYNETQFHQFDKYLLGIKRVKCDIDEINRI